MSHHMTHGYIARSPCSSINTTEQHVVSKQIPAISASDIFDTESNSLIASRKLSHQSAHVCVAHPAYGIPYVVSYVRSQVTRDSPVHASKSWQRIPPVPPSTPRQKIPSLCGLVVVVVVLFMSAFFLSLSSLSLSQLSLYHAWCLLLNGAKETGTHLTDTRERERGESKALQDYYAKYLLRSTLTY